MTTLERPNSARVHNPHTNTSQIQRQFDQPQHQKYNQKPKLETKQKTLHNSILDNQKKNAQMTARTNYAEGAFFENPENDYASQLKQNKSSIYVQPRQSSLPKKTSNKYGEVHGYQDIPNQKSLAREGQCVLANAEQQTLRKLVAMSVKHHDPTLCVCAYCTCGRHLCKVHPVKPSGPKPLSIYKKDYDRKNPLDNLKFRPSTSYKDQNPKIDPLSTYTKDYPPKESQIDPKFVPQGLLKTGGPFSGNTTYGVDFPGYKGPATQTLKPYGGEVVHGFPFNGNTSYRKQYVPKDSKLMDPIKANGNLKLGEPWIGGSTYRSDFMKPNNTYATGWKSKPSNIVDPKNPNQYDTTYRNDYVPMQSNVCPAIPELMSRSKFFSTSKNPDVFKQSRRALSLVKGV